MQAAALICSEVPRSVIFRSPTKMEIHSEEISCYFPITQILREINLGDSRGAKFAILTHLEALIWDFYEFLHFLKPYICQIHKIQKL